MNLRKTFASVSILTLVVAVFAGCGSATPEVETAATTSSNEALNPAPAKEAPPESGPATDVSFPKITRTTLDSGLEINTVEAKQLPVAYVRLVVHSGGSSDPERFPGLAHLVTAMLKEGTKSKSSAELAEAIEFLGADISVSNDQENIYVYGRSLSDQLDELFSLVADMTLNPAFDGKELTKLKKREENRLTLQENNPRFLAKREFYQRIYGEHPYARIDTTKAVIKRVLKTHMFQWHRKHFVANNATLVVVGDVDAAAVTEAAKRAFSKWKKGKVPEVTYPEIPERDTREVVLVDRPESDQSTIVIGNLALARGSEDYIPMRVANQVLGGSAASRLFMDLREKRDLTYGAYSYVPDTVKAAPFMATANVRNDVTGQAMQAFYEHLDRIVAEAPPADELKNAHRYLSDRFPLQIDTPARIAGMVAKLRIYDLPDNYWDEYRSSIAKVSAEQALATAQRYIHPDKSLVVVVGRAADVVDSLKAYGKVTVVDRQGNVTETFEQGTEAAKK